MSLEDLEKIYYTSHKILIYGATGSGKSYFIENFYLNKIGKIYDDIIVFTREQNRIFYQNINKRFKTLQIYTDYDNRLNEFIENYDDFIIEKIKYILQLQIKNVKRIDKTTNETIYKSKICIIFDDIILDKLFKSETFKSGLIYNSRKLQISIVLSSQITSQEIQSTIKSNFNLFVLFPVNDVNQKKYMISLIRDCIDNNSVPYKYLQDKERIDNTNEDDKLEDKYNKIIYRRAKKIYNTWLNTKEARKKHNFLIIDAANQMYK